MKKEQKKINIDTFLNKLKDHYEVGTIKAVLERLDIKRSTYDTWKARGHVPDEQLYKIAEVTGLSKKYLQNAEEYECVEDAGVIYDQKREETIVIPYNEQVYASAGGGSYDNVTFKLSPITFSRDFVHHYLGLHNTSGLSIINAAGDSMDPTIRSGELMIVNKFGQEGFKDGAIYVIVCGDALLVKRVMIDPNTAEYILSSDNASIDDIRLTIDEGSDCHFVGRVVGHMDRV